MRRRCLPVASFVLCLVIRSRSVALRMAVLVGRPHDTLLLL